MCLHLVLQPLHTLELFNAQRLNTSSFYLKLFYFSSIYLRAISSYLRAFGALDFFFFWQIFINQKVTKTKNRQ